MPADHPRLEPRLEPFQIAAETFVISSHHLLEEQLGIVPINAMLIRGAQPIVVDTGAPVDRRQFLDDVFSLVAPDDVRWLFLSHDDLDHAGNAEAVMEACPNATLVTTWLATHRMAAAGMAVPADRCVWLADDEVFDAGDRALVLLRPPLYDAPATRGLLDTSTGAYWAADCFAAVVPHPAADVADLEAAAWRDGFTRFHQWNSPWFEAVDPGWWQRGISRFEAHQPSAIVSAHGPVIRSGQVPAAIEMLRELPALPVAPQPDQQLLHRLLAAPRPDVV